MTGGAAGPGRSAAAFQALVAATEGLQPWRRALHALTGVVLVWVPWALGLSRPVLLLGLAAGFVLLLGADLVRLAVPGLNALAFRALRPLVSPREADKVASSTWYVLGVLAAYALFPRPVAIAAILVLAFADPAASLVGRAWGSRRIGKGSVQGGVAFFAVAMVVLTAVLGFEGVMPLRALFAAALATVIEVTPLGLDDNLTVPLAAGGGLQLAFWVG